MPEQPSKGLGGILIDLGVKAPLETVISAGFSYAEKFRVTMPPKWRYVFDAIFAKMALRGFLVIDNAGATLKLWEPLGQEWADKLLEEAEEFETKEFERQAKAGD